MKTITIEIEGMMCAHCEKRVTQAITALNGVESCEASAANNHAVVTFDEARVKEEDLKAAIEEVGYDVT